MTRREPVWICIEGVNGVGKTHLAQALAARLRPDAVLLTELTDPDTGDDPTRDSVMTALTAGRSFLRTGHPVTETFALLALKVREYEHVLAMADPPAVVIEDRGVDTVAIYQAVILAAGPDDDLADHDAEQRVADEIYATAAEWRPPPDRTLLLLDDLEHCADRYADRERRVLTGEERDLVGHADRLYRWRAAREPERFRIVHRSGREETELVAELERHVLDAVGAGR